MAQVQGDALSSRATPPARSTTRSMKKERGHGGGGHSTVTAKPKCGAVTRGTDATRNKPCDGHPCLRVAGHGTSHLGTGRCKYHGGANPIKHGLYSKVVPLAMRDSYLAALASEDKQSMDEHLALLDGVILPGALQRGINRPTRAGEMDPLMLQLAALETKSKILKRIHDIEDQTKIRFTEAGLEQLVGELMSGGPMQQSARE